MTKLIVGVHAFSSIEFLTFLHARRLSETLVLRFTFFAQSARLA